MLTKLCIKLYSKKTFTEQSVRDKECGDYGKILRERITLLCSEKLREVEKAIISPGYWIKYLLPLQYSIL